MTVTRNATLSIVASGISEEDKVQGTSPESKRSRRDSAGSTCAPCYGAGIDELAIVNELPAFNAVEDMNAPVPPSEPVSQSLLSRTQPLLKHRFRGYLNLSRTRWMHCQKSMITTEVADPNLNENVTTVSELDTLVEFGADILDDESEASLTDESAGFENAVFPVDREEGDRGESGPVEIFVDFEEVSSGRLTPFLANKRV